MGDGFWAAVDGKFLGHVALSVRNGTQNIFFGESYCITNLFSGMNQAMIFAFEKSGNTSHLSLRRFSTL
jgi:hypothetical protein